MNLTGFIQICLSLSHVVVGLTVRILLCTCTKYTEWTLCYEVVYLSVRVSVTRGVGRGGQGVLPPNGGSPKNFSHNNGSVQMPPGLPEFIMGSYYYQRCYNLLQMHRPTQRGRCWSQELSEKSIEQYRNHA